MDLPPSKIEWHLVRDGKPYGPLSDLEFFKFIELGHLEPNDLLWRDGFKGWQSANVVVCRACSIAGECESPVQPDGGEGLAKHKGVIARWHLKEVWSKAAT